MVTDANFVVKKGLNVQDGDISIKGSNKELRFYEGSNYVGFEAPALSANKIWVLPSADGSTGQVLKTDGSGNLGWVSAASLTGAVTTIGTGSANAKLTSNGSHDLVLTTNTNAGFTEPYMQFNDGDGGHIYVVPGNNANSKVSLGRNANSKVEINGQYTLPQAVTGTNDYVLTAQTNGTTAWAAASATNVVTAAENGSGDWFSIPFVASATGSQQLKTDTGLAYRPSANKLSVSGDISTTGTIILEDGSGYVKLGGSNSNMIRYYDDDSSHYVAIDAPATISTNYTLILPNADGSANQVLQTDGSGNLSWATAGGDSNAGGVNGSASAVTFGFTSDTDTGMYRVGAGLLGFTSNGQRKLQVDPYGITVGDGNSAGYISSEGTQDLILRTNDGTNSGVIRMHDSANGDIDINPNGNGAVRINYDTTNNNNSLMVSSIGVNDTPFSSTIESTSNNQIFTAAQFINAINSGSRTTGFGAQIEFRLGELNYSGYLAVKIGAKMKDTGNSNFDMFITPSGTGNLALGNFTLDADQTVGSGQDNYVMTYDHSAGTIGLEAATGGGIASLAADTTPQLGGDLDVNGNKITSASNADITIEPDGTGDILLYSDKMVVGDSSANWEIAHRTTTNSLLRFQAGGNVQLIADDAIYLNSGEGGSNALIRLKGDTINTGNSGVDKTYTTQGTGDLIFNTNAGTNSGEIKIFDGANGDINITPNGTGQVNLGGAKVGVVTDVTIGSGTSGTTTGVRLGANQEAGMVAGEVSNQSTANDGYIELMNMDLDAITGASGLQTIELTVQIEDETNQEVESFKALVQATEKTVLGTTARAVNFTEWAILYDGAARIGTLAADYDSSDDTIRIRYQNKQGSTATLTATFYAITMQNNT